MSKPAKLLAIYLPQFHSFPENDEWWGKGFTEWTNTKKAKPLFMGHYQPRTPLGGNYYDLSTSEEMRRQSDLARRAGIYGFCFYHYWFNGKLLLQKPLHNYLEDPECSLPFCFSWANEPWTRTWDGNKGSQQILMPQEYGTKENWVEHFEYLYQFFRDDRYIKIDNKPLFLIYRTESIPQFQEMAEVWKECCREKGFDGIYIVKMKTAFVDNHKYNGIDATCSFEPMETTKKMPRTPRKKIVQNTFLRKIPFFIKWAYPVSDYDELYENLLARKTVQPVPNFRGCFVDWDNTARRGEKVTRLVRGACPRKFEKYLRRLVDLVEEEESEFIFINAWNEWAEGAYLEPDERFGYGYLNAVHACMKGRKKPERQS